MAHLSGVDPQSEAKLPFPPRTISHSPVTYSFIKGKGAQVLGIVPAQRLAFGPLSVFCFAKWRTGPSSVPRAVIMTYERTRRSSSATKESGASHNRTRDWRVKETFMLMGNQDQVIAVTRFVQLWAGGVQAEIKNVIDENGVMGGPLR